MITAHYRIKRQNTEPLRPNLLDEEVIKLRRARFDPVLAQLRCDRNEHFDFENIIIVFVSPTESFVIEKACCPVFEIKIVNALTEICKNR